MKLKVKLKSYVLIIKDEIDRKIEERDLQLVVPGYERTGEVLPKPEEASKFRKATAVSEQLSSKLNRMNELVNKYGSFERGGQGAGPLDGQASVSVRRAQRDVDHRVPELE